MGQIFSDAAFALNRSRWLGRFFRACEIARFNTDTKLTYEKDMITERDYYNIINTARKTGMSAGMEQGLQKGLRQGLQQGLERGREEGLIEGQSKERMNIAKSMKAKGISNGMIAELTGLSETEVASL